MEKLIKYQLNDDRTLLDLEKQGVQVLSPAPNSRVFKDDLLISLSYFQFSFNTRCPSLII